MTPDVRNAFNSASLAAITDALLRRVPVQDSRKLLPESSTSLRHRGGSEVLAHSLGPVLWNVMHDDVILSLKLPAEVAVVGFADYIMLSVCGESIEEVELTVAISIAIVNK